MKLKIAELSPIAWRTPPRQYGPWEQVVSSITEGLAKRGHDVTLFATADSITRAKLVSVCPRPLHEDDSLESRLYECWHNSTCFEMAEEFDLIHNHYDFPPLTYSKLVKTPVVTTVHGFHSPAIIPLYRKYNNTYFISISYSDRKNAPDLNWVANVYHGLKLKDFDFKNRPEDFLLFLGRISMDKGTHLAIDVARKTNKKLIIAGIVPPEEKGYFEKLIKPSIDSKQIEFIGPVDVKAKNDLLGRALAMLHLVTFEEPFGLTLIESMATGTPVIAIKRGSIPEVVEDGVTGFIVENELEAIKKVSEIDKIDRRACRKRVEQNFTTDIMAENYLKAFEKVLEIEKSKK